MPHREHHMLTPLYSELLVLLSAQNADMHNVPPEIEAPCAAGTPNAKPRNVRGLSHTFHDEVNFCARDRKLGAASWCCRRRNSHDRHEDDEMVRWSDAHIFLARPGVLLASALGVAKLVRLSLLAVRPCYVLIFLTSFLPASQTRTLCTSTLTTGFVSMPVRPINGVSHHLQLNFLLP